MNENMIFLLILGGVWRDGSGYNYGAVELLTHYPEQRTFFMGAYAALTRVLCYE